MKNLKENAMMQEMNLQEMKEVNGGLIRISYWCNSWWIYLRLPI